MVLLTTTPTILHAISLLPSDGTNSLSSSSKPSDTEQSPASPLPTEVNAPISHRTLVQISKCLLASQSENQYTLNALLRGTHPYRPPPPPKPEPTPEYKALMARLKAEEERKAYWRMLQSQKERDTNVLQAQSPETHGTGLQNDPGNDDGGEDDISPSLVLNILLSIVMCAAVAFHLTRWWPNDGVRVLVALGTAVLVGVAEVVVYNSFLRKKREGRQRERRRREVKVVMGEFTGEEAEAIEAWGEKRQIDTTEVVWGKGVHGGMRKRVRERWEKEQNQQQKTEVLEQKVR